MKYHTSDFTLTEKTLNFLKMVMLWVIHMVAIPSSFLRFVLILKVSVLENNFVFISKKLLYFDLCSYFWSYFRSGSSHTRHFDALD